jgi:hypothetical protein
MEILANIYVQYYLLFMNINRNFIIIIIIII